MNEWYPSPPSKNYCFSKAFGRLRNAMQDPVRNSYLQFVRYRMGAERKALIFTESRRTQERLKSFLEENRDAGNVGQEIFHVEDEITENRDALIAELERRLSQKTEREELFTIIWKVI